MALTTLKSQPKSDDMKPENRPYQPFGGCAEIFSFKGDEGLLAGAAGTGKSLAILSKIFLCCEKYPNTRALIVRKTRESMTQSVLVTWEEKVIPEGHPVLQGPHRSQRKEYKFPNGSRVIVAGMRQSSRDNSQQIMSTDYDIVYVPEAIELSEEEWEKLTTRLRNGRMPYQQIIADTNPSGPQHWLKKRCDRGRCKMIHTTHTDNPYLWDMENKTWTQAGAKYLDKLDNLTGARRDRLRWGKWVQAEGVVYENWNENIHVVSGVEIQPTWRRFCAIDFGYNDPFVCGWFALDHDDHLYLYRQYVKTKRLVEDHAREIEYLSKDDPPIEAYICDHDAEGRATLEKHLGISTVAARKAILTGIQLVEARLAVQGDGKPRFMVLDDSLLFRDENMEDAKLPIGLVEEISEYQWLVSPSVKQKELPVDKNNHVCDILRYCSAHLDEGVWVGPGKGIQTPEEETKNPVQEWRSRKTAGWRTSGTPNWRLRDEV